MADRVAFATADEGPASGAPPAAADDLVACEALMRGGSKSFFAASRVLPARVRAPAIALYAFCRVADDAIDLADDPAAAVERLDARLDAIYARRPQSYESDRALAVVVDRFDLPRGLLDALIEGFRWDSEGRRYETIGQLEDYCARVAGTVGAMMAILMGTRSRTALARACELGVAMQLTNIARDVGEDARNGRLYLPREWLREEGIDPQAWLRQPSFVPGIGRVVARLLALADTLYQRAEQGIAELPRDCRAAIMAARLVYAEIGREVERNGLDSLTRRAVVSTSRKTWLITRAMLARATSQRPLPGASDEQAPVMVEAIRYLVEHAVEPAALRATAAPDSFYERAVWVIELCERLRERDRLAAARS
ncbi:MAG: phytoene/squalene synthase family protein [Rhodocyclaceae bacterium]|nr:phytoene/squalene synthase family protein [Rhodocyclaceae bacterium]MCA3073313.1 phytoene/squalene synthase family protein [Rhodocyclaceae bacterium]MCA3091353.1 phytoene/squalene synthase family protein [Rhodocyclaceae bacterium]MCA3094162.1 phytoene/squalene synthase family protein [Rhodocyclaceae bacterium]MCA3098336.1 phytoene/squalene synthase family protein [Rhodocyclaceae bacterium]